MKYSCDRRQVNPYADLVHSDTTVRSGHSRAKGQIIGTNETVVKYVELPSSWGDTTPSREAQRDLFRSETADHESPDAGGGEHLIVNVWRPIRGPVEQYPLALLDARTIAQDDSHPTILQHFDNSPGGQAGAVGESAGDDETTSKRNTAGSGQDESELKVVDLDGRKQRFRVGEVLTPLYDEAHRWHVVPKMQKDEVLLLKVFDSRTDIGRARFNCHCAVVDPHGPLDVHRESIEVRCLIVLPLGGGGARL